MGFLSKLFGGGGGGGGGSSSSATTYNNDSSVKLDNVNVDSSNKVGLYGDDLSNLLASNVATHTQLANFGTYSIDSLNNMSNNALQSTQNVAVRAMDSITNLFASNTGAVLASQLAQNQQQNATLNEITEKNTQGLQAIAASNAQVVSSLVSNNATNARLNSDTIQKIVIVGVVLLGIGFFIFAKKKGK